MLRNSVAVAVAVMRTHPGAILLAMITMGKSTHVFPFFFFLYEYGSPLGGPSGRRSSALSSRCIKQAVMNIVK